MPSIVRELKDHRLLSKLDQWFISSYCQNKCPKQSYLTAWDFFLFFFHCKSHPWYKEGKKSKALWLHHLCLVGLTLTANIDLSPRWGSADSGDFKPDCSCVVLCYREKWCHMTQKERDDISKIDENIAFGQLGWGGFDFSIIQFSIIVMRCYTWVNAILYRIRIVYWITNKYFPVFRI